MKALKITLALLAITVLTVSGVQSDKIVVDNEPTYKTYNSYDLIAHNKDKAKLKSKQ
ncbi:hypothetical protein [Winogradskyella flava]|uniref:Uncharacterized protein n=1 Tax=Winogradskyella flava TaxID=1884876 RepID=A0A842IN74_9FLAO|nr:hypothetical protein [Winogradskyella flava]MBC2844211.1 hypothetical protein [Winogradskyella flava]